MKKWLAAALLAACLPTAKPVNVDYIVLEARAPASPPSSPTGTLGLSRLTLPGYLDRGELATRSGTRITYSPTERWAEPLADSVPRLLAGDLAAAVGPKGFVVSLRAAGDLALVVDIERFERDADGKCILDVRYSLRDTVADKILKTGAQRYEETASGPTGEATASALAKVLERLAADVASGVTTTTAR